MCGTWVAKKPERSTGQAGGIQKYRRLVLLDCSAFKLNTANGPPFFENTRKWESLLASLVAYKNRDRKAVQPPSAMDGSGFLLQIIEQITPC